MIAAAGTADLPVADECATVLGAFGIEPNRLTDVGVAGVHRLLGESDALASADAVVVVAGMEGALASLVGGLTPAPVVAVPTSVGYGASLEGVTALLAMLSSCAAGLTVVGIDNGYGAACAVLRMLKSSERAGTVTQAAPGSTASPASPATWRSARSSTPAPTSTRCARWSSGSRCTAGGSRPSRCSAAASPPPRRTSTPRRPRSCAPRRTSPR